MKYLLTILLTLVSFSVFAGETKPFTLNQDIEGYRVSLDCKAGKCDGKASKFIFSDTFKADYLMIGDIAIITISDKVNAVLSINISTGAYNYEWS